MVLKLPSVQDTTWRVCSSTIKIFVTYYPFQCTYHIYDGSLGVTVCVSEWNVKLIHSKTCSRRVIS